jgi:FkbM family methyltransferase
MSLAFKRSFVRTPLERPLKKLRHALGFVQRRRHPELYAIHAEEALIEAVLDRAITPHTHCLDIGCHIGSMLSEFLRRAPQGSHAAVEADPDKARWLAKRFPEVDMHATALSDQQGEVTFYRQARKAGFSGLADTLGKGATKITVPCARLDDLMEIDKPIDFVKLDVEGAELFVLRGAGAFFERHRPLLLFECGPAGPKAFGCSPGELHDEVTQVIGYDVFFLKDWLEDVGPVSRTAFEEALVYPFKAFNWIAAPRG